MRPPLSLLPLPPQRRNDYSARRIIRLGFYSRARALLERHYRSAVGMAARGDRGISRAPKAPALLHGACREALDTQGDGMGRGARARDYLSPDAGDGNCAALR